MIGVLTCALAAAPEAGAQVQPAGTGEPAFTNSQQNRQFFEWPATSGADGYRIQFRYYANNTETAAPTYTMTNGGSVWADWSGIAALQHGGQYGICAQGHYSFPNDSLFYPDGPNSCSMGTMLGRRAHTTIDRSKPTAAISLASGAEFTKSTQVTIKTDFADDVAGPFPANFLCFQYGGGPNNVCDTQAGFIYGYNANCSVPSSAGKSTSFLCTADYGNVPDGPLWSCVIAADAAIPETNLPDQRQSADKANLSNPVCDGVVLDRTAPSAAIDTATTSVKVGDLVSFAVQASDAGSGLSSSYAWKWGDNTADGSGDSATHTFTQAGTYEVKLSTSDAVGNPATATKVITVAPASTGGGSGGDGGGGNSGGGNSGGGNSGGTGSTAGGSSGGGNSGGGNSGGTGSTVGGSSTGGTSVTSIREIVREAGGSGGTQSAAVGGALDIIAPRKVTLGKAKAVPLALTAESAGQASFALVRSGRVVARGSARIARAGTTSYRLKLPKKAKAGRYSLKVTFKPNGGKAATKSLKVTLAGKTGASKARLSTNRSPVVHGGPTLLPDGRFHGERPTRRFAADALSG